MALCRHESDAGDGGRVRAGRPTVSPPASGRRMRVSPTCVVSQFCQSETKIFGVAIQDTGSKWKQGWRGVLWSGYVAMVGRRGWGGGVTKSYKCETADRKCPPNQGDFTHLGRRATRFTSLHRLSLSVPLSLLVRACVSLCARARLNVCE